MNVASTKRSFDQSFPLTWCCFWKVGCPDTGFELTNKQQVTYSFKALLYLWDAEQPSLIWFLLIFQRRQAPETRSQDSKGGLTRGAIPEQHGRLWRDHSVLWCNLSMKGRSLDGHRPWMPSNVDRSLGTFHEGTGSQQLTSDVDPS